MARISTMGAVSLCVCFAGGCVTVVEQAKYTVVQRTGNCEIREYPPSVVAETLVSGNLVDAGNKAFGRLFDYISGNNRTQGKIAMTTPVSQRPASERIAMTAPVGQRPAEGGWIVSFAMPASYTIDTLPVPESQDVTLRQVPACRMAAVRYSGTWSEERYLRYKRELESWIAAKGLIVLGEAVWARYNPPFTPWFLRRNEILIPVAREDRGGRPGDTPTVPDAPDLRR